MGVIGAGMIAGTHIRNLQRTGRAKVDWVAARDPDNLEAFRKEFGIPNKTHDYRDMLRDQEVEVVLVTTPPHLHREMFIAALEAGKHVLLEKPMALGSEDVIEMLNVRASHPRQVAMECSCRHARLTPKFRKVKELIDTGVLGRIYAIHHSSVQRQHRPGIEFHPSAKWFLDKNMAGAGPLFDWGVYDLSFHLGILGDRHGLEEIFRVDLYSGLDESDPGTDVYDVEEHFMADLMLDSGIRYFWERGGHANVEAPNETRIYGTRGGLRLGYCSWDAPFIEFFDLDRHGKARKQVIELDYNAHDDGYALTEHLIRVLDGEEEPVITLEQAARHMEILFGCLLAGEPSPGKTHRTGYKNSIS